MSTALDDASLVARCRAGDERAWTELVERFSRYVYAIAARAYGLSDPDAEDVFQEVFRRVYERLDGLRSDAAVRPWIGQLTRRLCIDRLRAAAREVPAEGIEPRGVEDTMEILDQALTVQGAMAGLSKHCREVLDRFFCRDQSYATIGEELSIPPGTIASRISRCLSKLRSLVGEDLQIVGAS
jgi:RNA polymerase sigma-70 factor (ECF subfamily)